MIDWPRMWNDETRRFSPTRMILYLASLAYGRATAVRNALYDGGWFQSVRLPRPVVSIGNITVGGTGKTPCVILLAKRLQAHGLRPAVISRGYGGKSPLPVNVVSDGENILLNAATAGDEPLLIARSLPGVCVLTGPKRALTGRAAVEQFGADVILCDDAFQHRQIQRDINLVLLDDRRPLGNGHLLPRGELREHPAGLARADAFLLTRADLTRPPDSDILAIARQHQLPVFRCVHRAVSLLNAATGHALPPEALRGKKICAFCGIAKPDSFLETLSALGADVVSFNPFPDHHAFTRRDLDDLQRVFQMRKADYLITTQKDVMRLESCPEFLNMVWDLSMQMDIPDSAPAFDQWLLDRIAAAAAPDLQAG